MVQGKWFPMGSDLTLPVSLRHSVFGRGRDALDDQAWQVVVYQGDLPVGSARLWWEDGAFRLGDVGVLAAYRGQGFGDLLVRLLLFKALTHGAGLRPGSAHLPPSRLFLRSTAFRRMAAAIPWLCPSAVRTCGLAIAAAIAKAAATAPRNARPARCADGSRFRPPGLPF